MLRIGWCLQRDGDGRFDGTAGREDGKRAKNEGKKRSLTANPGCILQLRAGAAIHNTGQEVMHVVELLDRASLQG